MPNSIDFTIQPPIGGIQKRTSYQTQPPFSTYDSLNFWPVDPKTGRAVSATRPPLTAATMPAAKTDCNMLSQINGVAAGKPYQSMVGAFDSDIYWWDGNSWEAATGAQASAVPVSRAVYAAPFLQKVYIATDTNKPIVFNYVTGSAATIVETAGTAPSDARMVVVWQGAVWLAGVLATPHVLYASRTGDASDWDYSVPATDEGGAFFSGSGNFAGLLRGPITALMPQTEDTMIVSTVEGLFAVRRHPRRGGDIIPISDTVYTLGQGAWTKAPGDILYFLTPLGLMSLAPGPNSIPAQVSREKIPAEILGLIYTYENPVVSMAYDSKWNGIIITVRGIEEQAWWYDLQLGGFHRMEFQGYPYVMMEFPPFISESSSGVLFAGAAHGGLAVLDAFGSEQFESGLIIGPFQISDNAMQKSILTGLRVVLGRDTPNSAASGSLSVSAGTDGQDAVNRLLIGGRQFSANLSTIKSDNGICFPRAVGHAVVIELTASTGDIVFEEAVVTIIPAGRNNVIRTIQLAVEGEEFTFTPGSETFDSTAWQGYSKATPNVPCGTLTDFTHWIDLSLLPASWWSVVSYTGGDIRITDDNNNEVPIDLISFDKTANTGFLTLKMTQVIPPRPVRIWIGNSSVSGYANTATYGGHNAYDANWIAFWPSGGQDSVDRTVKANVLTLTGTDATCLVTGTIGVQATRYTTLDATNNYGRATAFVPTTTPATLVVVAKDTDTTAVSSLGLRSNVGDAAENLELQNARGAVNQTAQANTTQADSTSAAANSTALANSANFRHFAGIFAANNSRTAYIDGGNSGTNTTTKNVDDLDEIIIGKGSRSGLSSSSVTADLALAQVHNTARSSCWVQYQEEMLDQTDFWNGWSAFEEINPPTPPDDPGEVGTWSGYAEATPIAAITNTQANWAHWIDLSLMPAQWWSAVSTSGVDIRATNSSNIFIPLDLIEFNKVAMTGFATVKLSQSNIDGQPIRLWVGNATAITIAKTISYGQYAVYEGTYKGFWPQGGGNDRTSAQKHLTMFGSPTVGGATGPIGNTATSYNGTNQYGSVSISSVSRDPFTISAVVKANNLSSKMASASLNRTVYLGHSTLLHEISSTPARIEVRAYNETRFAASSVAQSAGTWYHESGIVVSPTLRGVIVSGTGPDTAATNSVGPHDYTRFNVGARLSGSSTIYWPWNGDISLVSLFSNGTRSYYQNWSKYQNAMLNQATFWGAGWVWTAQVSGLPQ